MPTALGFRGSSGIRSAGDEWYQLRADYLIKRRTKLKGKLAEESWKWFWCQLCQLTEAAPTAHWQILLSALIAMNYLRLYGMADGWSSTKSNLDGGGARELKDFSQYSLMSLGGDQYQFYKCWWQLAGKEEWQLLDGWKALERKLNGRQLRRRFKDFWEEATLRGIGGYEG